MKHYAIFNYIRELEIDLETAKNCSHAGRCDNDVQRASKIPYIKKQLDAIDPEKLRQELFNYGAWTGIELSSHEDNLQRILWIACGNIVEENYNNTK